MGKYLKIEEEFLIRLFWPKGFVLIIFGKIKFFPVEKYWGAMVTGKLVRTWQCKSTESVVYLFSSCKLLSIFPIEINL